MKFPLGKVVATPGALDAIACSCQMPQQFIDLHAAGNWGDINDDEHDRKANEDGLINEGRLMSAYTTANGTKIWVITEWDRSVTTILLPTDY